MDSRNRPIWPGVVTLVLDLLLLLGCIGYVVYIVYTDPTAGGNGWLVCIGGIVGVIVSALLINDGYLRLSGHDLGVWESVGDFFRGVGYGLAELLGNICLFWWP